MLNSECQKLNVQLSLQNGIKTKKKTKMPSENMF